MRPNGSRTMKPLAVVLVDIQTRKFLYNIEAIIGMEFRSILMNVHLLFMDDYQRGIRQNFSSRCGARTFSGV